MRKNQYVVPTESGWSVRGENNEKLTKNFEKKADAIDYAKKIAKNQQSELTILKRQQQC